MQANSKTTTFAPWPPAAEGGAAGAARGSAWRTWWAVFGAAWRTDWRERLRDRRTLPVLLLALALACGAAVLTAQQLRTTLQARAQAQAAERERWLQQGRKNPHAAAHHGVYVFKPLSPLAAIEPGVGQHVGATVWLEAHKQNEMLYRPANDEPGSARAFALTPAFVLQAVAPLALVFLGFGSFAAERERGLLATLRLTGAPLSAVAAARAAVLWCLGVAIAAPGALAALAVQLHFAGQWPFADAADAVLRSASLAAAQALYLAFWALAIVALSAASGTLLRALLAGIGLWALLTLVLPRAAWQSADAAVALPSAQAFRERLEAALAEPSDPAETVREQQALLARHGVKELKELPVNWAGIGLQRGEEHGDRIFDAHYQQLFAAFAAQSRHAAAWGWLSPAVAVAGLSSAAAASDTAHHVQFVQDAEAHRRLIQRVMNDAITAHPDRDGQRYQGDQALWRQVPAFVFRFRPLGSAPALLQQSLQLLGGVLVALAACALALRRLGRGALR